MEVSGFHFFFFSRLETQSFFLNCGDNMDDYYVNPRLPLHAFSPLQAERHQMQCHPEFPLRVPTVRGEDQEASNFLERENTYLTICNIFTQSSSFFAVSQAKSNSGGKKGGLKISRPRFPCCAISMGCVQRRAVSFHFYTRETDFAHFWKGRKRGRKKDRGKYFLFHVFLAKHTRKIKEKPVL